MPASLAEDLSKVLFETDEFKGYVDSGIKSIAPLLVGTGLGAFVPFLSPLIIAGLTSHLLPKALRVAGNKIEIANEQLQQYQKEGGSKGILAKVASPCLGVLKKVLPPAPEKELHDALSEGGTRLKEFLSAILNDEGKRKEFEDNLQKFLTGSYGTFEEFQRNVKETMAISADRLAIEAYTQFANIFYSRQILDKIATIAQISEDKKQQIGDRLEVLRSDFDRNLKDIEKTQREILERLKQVQEDVEKQVSAGASLELLTASKQYKKTDPNFCWKNANFSNADIRNGYDARRPVTDDIINSTETHEGTIVYGDPYVGKSVLIKRIILEMIDKGYVVLYSSGASTESNAYKINGILTSLSRTHRQILFVADDVHKSANEPFFEIFNELYDTTAEEGIRFLFAAREKQLDKENNLAIARALTKIPKEAQFRIGFSLDDALLFLQRAVEVTLGMKSAITDKFKAHAISSAKKFYEISRGDPFMFSFYIKYALQNIEYAREGKRAEPENLVSKEMMALIKEIEKIEKEERIQEDNKLWKAAILSAILGIANIRLDRGIHPKLFTCSKIPHSAFQTLLEKKILLKRSDEGQLRIRHEVLAYEFLSVLYENREYFDNNPELFNAEYGDIIKCIWEGITVDEIIDMLNACSYLHGIERYRPISELIISHYLVPPDKYSPHPGIQDSDKAKLLCYGLGNLYANWKEHEEAIKCYDKALEIKPDYVNALNNKGSALFDLARYEDAIACYDKALEIKPDYPSAWYNKGLILSNLARYEDAIACYDKALEINANATYALNNKGSALFNLTKYEEAIACYDKAIAIDADHVIAWYNKGLILFGLARYEDAIACYDKALEIAPDYSEAWYNKGNALFTLERYKEAIKCYDKALVIEPDYVNALTNKGLSLYNLGKHEEAINCYDKALEIAPDYSEAWYNKGLILDNLTKYEEAIACYDKAIAIDADHVIAWYSKGHALSNIDKHEEAINCYDKALEIAPDYSEAWYNKGLILDNLTKYEEAIACYDKAIAIDANDVDAWNGKGVTLLNIGKYEEAIAHFDKAVKLDQNYADAWYNISCCRAKEGNIVSALDYLKKAIKIDKNYIESAKEDKDFDSIRNDERFKALVG